MLALFGRALLFWLALFELIAAWRRWWGLSWLGHQFPRRWFVPLIFALNIRVRWLRWIVGLLCALPPALLLQIVASSLRNQQLNPLLRLRPGSYERYTIERLDIPMSQGHLPALHVVPRAGAKAAVCIVHGSGCDKTSYVWRLLDAVVNQGLALLLIDMDGHGENPRLQSFPAITENAAVAVDWLRAHYARVALLGISLGGCVAARAVSDGVAVDALVLLESPPWLAYTQADVYREAIALIRPNLFDIFSDCTVQALIKAWEYPPIRATIGTVDLIAALDLRASLATIHAPLLAIYGGSDAIVKPTQAAHVWAALPAGAQFHLVPGASHLNLILTPSTVHTVSTWLSAMLTNDLSV